MSEEVQSERPETMEEAVQRIAFEIVEEAPQVARMLVLMQRKDGTARSIDTGLTVDEAKNAIMGYHSWLDQCIGREMEKNEKDSR
jgi:hypothetical protein